MKIHELKTWPVYFDAVYYGGKPFEVRKNDRGFQQDDVLVLREFEPSTAAYTGRELARLVTYILAGDEAGTFGLAPGVVIMGLGLARMSIPLRVDAAVEVLKPKAIMAPPFTWLPGTVVAVAGRDEFANSWSYKVKTADGVLDCCSNTVRPLTSAQE